MFRLSTLLVALTVSLTTLLATSAAGPGRRHHRSYPCQSPCAAPADSPCLSYGGTVERKVVTYYLYICSGHTWVPEGSSSTKYDALYQYGTKTKHWKYHHHSEQCGGHAFAAASFTIAPSDVTPSGNAPPAMGYRLWYCTSSGWQPGDYSTDYDALYQHATNDLHLTPLDCSETCMPGWGGGYFTICPDSAVPGSAFRCGCQH
jgi:hypothetical protein